MKKFGIDISHWQGVFDLKAAKAEGVEFVIIKGGGGDAGLYVDSRFDRNYNEAKKLGLPVGCYWFSKATSVAEAQREADYFVTNVLKGRQFELPVYMDVETSDQARLGKKALTDVVLAWLRAVQSAGYWVGLYSYTSYINTYLEDERLQGFAHWVAEWSTKCRYEGKEGVLGMWQFGGETNKIRSNKINGQTVDQNYMLIDYEPMIKAKGLNGFAKQAAAKPAAPAKKSEAEIAKEVLAGKWGNGVERKQRLEAAGYNYARIQTAVNELATGQSTKKAYTEIAREVIRGDWGNGTERKQKLIAAGYDYATVQMMVDELLG
jgi:hypothetical protein